MPRYLRAESEDLTTLSHPCCLTAFQMINEHLTVQKNGCQPWQAHSIRTQQSRRGNGVNFD
jgi:hypothetical protein